MSRDKGTSSYSLSENDPPATKELRLGRELGRQDVSILLPTGLTVFAHSTTLKVASGWFRSSMDPKWWPATANVGDVLFRYECVEDKNAEPDDEILQWTLIKHVQTDERDNAMAALPFSSEANMDVDATREQDLDEEQMRILERLEAERAKILPRVEKGFVALLAIIYDESLGNIKSLQLIRTLVHLADEYDCLKRVSPSIRGLLRNLSNLHNLIVSMPDLLLWISLKVQDSFVYAESFVHCAGRYLFEQTWVPNLWNEDFPSSLEEELDGERVRLMLLYHETQSLVFKVIDEKDYDETMHDIVRNRVLDAFAKMHIGTRVPFETLSSACFMPTATEELARRVDWSRGKYMKMVQDQTDIFRTAVSGLLLNNSRIDLSDHKVRHLTCATRPHIPWPDGEFDGYRFEFEED